MLNITLISYKTIMDINCNHF